MTGSPFTIKPVAMFDLDERPNRIPWPPLLYVGAAAAAVTLHFVWPLPWTEAVWRLFLAILGASLIALAVALYVSAVRAFRAHQTTIVPTRGATRLITSGAFRHSRNPLYLGNTLVIFGAGLLFGVAWLLLAAVIASALVQKLAIEREEKHLALRFAEEWPAYAARTPRWFGPL